MTGSIFDKRILAIAFVTILALWILASIAVQSDKNLDETNSSNSKTNSTNNTDILKNSQNLSQNKTNTTNTYINKTINNSQNKTLKKDNNSQPYKRQESKGVITYTFNTKEILELKIFNNNIGKDDAVYRTNVIGNQIVLGGEKYEKLAPGSVMHLAPIINNITYKSLKVNETLKLKDNYSFVITSINDKEFKSKILKNNKVIRDSIVNRNSPLLSIGLWKDITDDKKQKIIWINVDKINQKDVIVDVTQYGDKKVFVIGSKFGEFIVTNTTDNSITMKNYQPIKAEIGKEIFLVNKKIKIKV